MNRYIFTIRELVLLTLVVALGVGWWIDRCRLTDRIDELDGCQTIAEFLRRDSGQ
jgi:hypothetical protein